MWLAIATLSLGSSEHHNLLDKLRAAKDAGFSSVEREFPFTKMKALGLDRRPVYYPDYLKWERAVVPNAYIPGDAASLRAAKKLKSLCQDMGMNLCLMQPIMDFEGCLLPHDREEAMIKAQACLRITSALSISLVLIASRWQPSVPITSDLTVIAQDLGELADYGAELSPPVSISYEAIGWADVVNQWQQAWEVVRIADRPNLGLVIDTFNWLCREFADPYVQGGIQPGAQEYFESSLQEFLDVVPGHKLFFLQIADGRRFSRPMQPSGEDLPLMLQYSRKNVSLILLIAN